MLLQYTFTEQHTFIKHGGYYLMFFSLKITTWWMIGVFAASGGNMTFHFHSHFFSGLQDFGSRFL